MSLATHFLARTFSTNAVRNAAKQVTIVGGGLMGAGIAQVAATTGHKVTLVDLSDDLLQQSRGRILKSLERVVKKKYADRPDDGKKFLDESLGNLCLSTDAASAVSKCDIVVEAIAEKMELKQALFKTLDEAAPKETLFATNTSALPVKEIASVTKRSDRFAGLHFFNPVPMLKLLEVVRLPETSEESLAAFLDFGKALGKTTVLAKDTPGFIVNRLLLPYMTNAFQMLERGDASARDIDIAMRLGAGYPMGPLELADYVGLDTLKFIMDDWTARYPGEFPRCETLDRLVSEGKLGMKTGEGIYKHTK